MGLPVYLPVYLAATVIKDTPFGVLGRVNRYEMDFQKALGIPFLMHTVMMVICVLCIIKLMIAIVQLEYLRTPQERVMVKNRIRASIIGIVVVGLMPLIGDTILNIIAATMM